LLFLESSGHVTRVSSKRLQYIIFGVSKYLKGLTDAHRAETRSRELTDKTDVCDSVGT